MRGSNKYIHNPVSCCYLHVQLGFVLLIAVMTPSIAHAIVTGPTISNNTFASTPVGGSLTQTVSLTLTSVETIKSIALQPGQPGATEYAIQSVSGCTVDDVTQSSVGTVCNISIKFTPQLPGSTVSPTLARNATLLFTDSNANVFAYGLTGAATGPVAKVVPGKVSLYAGVAATGLNALDLGLGLVTGGYGGDNGPATSATFNLTGVTAINSLLTQPLALDSAGNLYVADAGNFIIRKIDNTSAHNVTTIAGTPTVTGTSAGSGGLATSATLAYPHAITVDAAGDIFFIDAASQYSSYSIVYRIDAATKIITAIGGQLYNPSDGYNSAGGGTCAPNLGTPGYYECGDGGLAGYASLPSARNLAVDPAGNLYLWESGGYIREIAASTGIITTYATAADFPSDVAGTPSFALGGMTLASDGNFYVLVDAGSYELIYELNTTTQAVTQIAGGQQPNYTGNCDSSGSVNGKPSAPIVDIGAGQAGYPGAQLFLFTNGVVASTGDLASDASGNIYYSGAQCNGADVYNYRPAVFRINLPTDTAYLETAGGSPGTATSNYGAYTGFNIAPASAIPDGNGNLYFTTNNQIGVISASAGALDFGQQNQFTTGITRIATYENVGNATDTGPTYSLASGLDFTDVSATDTNACNLLTQVGVNKTCNIDYEYTPVQPNNITDTINLAEAGPGSNPGFGLTTDAQTVTLTGDATPEAEFLVTPSSLSFGNVVVGQSVTKTFTVSNMEGGAALGLYGIYVYPSGVVSPPTEYTLDGTCDPSVSSFSVAAGDTCTITVTFTPTAVASYPTTLTINNSVTNPEGATFTITGAGAGTVTTSTTATLAPNPLMFSTVQVGSYSIGTATLTNTGSSSLTGITISFTGTNASAFSTYPASTCGTTLAAGDNCTIVIHFTPGSTGDFTATLSVADNATGSPQTIALTGMATAAPMSQVQFNPVQLNAIAGTGVAAPQCNDTGDGGAALQAELCTPYAAVEDASGNIYFVDQDDNVVKKIDTSGTITTFAGVANNGPGSFSGDNGPATAANLSSPVDVAVDLLGNVYISDYGNGRIRKVDTGGTITTFVGGASGYFNGGSGTGVALGPGGIAFDLAGNLYIADINQQIVVKVTPAGSASLFAGTQMPSGPGNAGYNGDSILATNAELNFPNNVATDQYGNVYIADTSNYRIRMVAAGSGMISTVAGNGTKGDTGDGGPATSAEIGAVGVGTNLAGDLFISDGSTIRKVGIASGNISTYAGGGTGGLGGPATSALLKGVGLPRVDNYGDLLIPVSGTPELLLAGPDGILQFGNQTVNTTSAPLTITVENTGDFPLSFTQNTFTASGDFTVTGGTCENLDSANSGGTCTLTVTFTPGTTGALTGTISMPSNAPGTPQTVLLQGTGTAAAAPTATLAPATLTFANTAVGATATAQTLTLSNTGNAVLNISGITIGGTNPSDFAETSTCGETLAANATCTISVTFTPASAASFGATVSVADNATGSPQTVALNGAGIAAPDFSVSASPPAQSVNPGASTTYNVTVGSINGDFDSAVTLSASGLPAGATATFAPPAVTPGSEPAGSVMTVQTASVLARTRAPQERWPWMPAVTMAFFIPLLWWRRRDRARLLSTGLLCALLSVGAGMLSGCGGGYYAEPPAQTYTITVTGTSGATQHSTTVTLTVQ